MHFSDSRRRLLKSALATAAGSCGPRGAAGLLAGLSATSVARAAGDYKALVCIMLYGGNDGFNLLVPSDSERYATYAATRSNLALPASALLPLSAEAAEGSYGLHGACGGLQQLFNAKRMAFVANAGTLLTPTTKSDVQNNRNLPPALYSHVDQQAEWMASEPDASPRVGWGGRLADLMSNYNANTLVSLNTTLCGTNLLQTGQFTVPYALSKNGVETYRLADPSKASRRELFLKLLDEARGSERLMEPVHGDSVRNSVEVADYLSAAMASSTAGSVSWPSSDLSTQLQMVARMISIRSNIQMSRQVFFCGLSTFDTHDNQLNSHNSLLTTLSEALTAFQSSLDELGVGGQVTTFSMSDFGRTLTSNGDGSDHAWGNNHFVMGGAIKGGKIYGSFPDLHVDSADDAGHGRLIPTTAVEQYGATLANWFGASSDEVDTIFPHLSRFASRNLGFV